MQNAVYEPICVVHITAMRNHADIIKDAGAARVSDHLGETVTLPTVNSWIARDSIPSLHWDALATGGITTLEELAKAAARSANESDKRRRRAKLATGNTAAA